MNTKKFWAAALSGAMALSLAAPAFAAGSDTTPPANQTVITGTYTAPVIDVTVPQVGAAMINPYGFDIYLDSEETAANAITGGQQIVTLPMVMQNLSKMDLAVYATVTGADPDGADGPQTIIPLNSTPLANDASTSGIKGTTKKAYVGVQMKVIPDATGSADELQATEPYTDEVLTLAHRWTFDAQDTTTPTITVKNGSDTKTTWGAPTAAKGAALGTGVVLPLAKLAASADGESTAAGGAALLRLTGNCTESPSAEWSSNEGLKVSVAFTFKPTEIAAADAKLANDSSNTAPELDTNAEDSAIDATSGKNADGYYVARIKDSTENGTGLEVHLQDSTGTAPSDGTVVWTQTSNTFTVTPGEVTTSSGINDKAVIKANAGTKKGDNTLVTGTWTEADGTVHTASVLVTYTGDADVT